MSQFLLHISAMLLLRELLLVILLFVWKQDLAIEFWLAWNLICSSDQSQSHRELAVPSSASPGARIKGVSQFIFNVHVLYLFAYQYY